MPDTQDDVSGIAKEKATAAVDKLSGAANDAKRVAGEAMAGAKEAAGDAKQAAHDAVDAGGEAISSAAQKTIDGLKAKITDLQSSSARYVADKPGTTVVLSLLVGFLLGAAVMKFSHARRFDWRER